MIRDENESGNDGLIIEYYDMDDIDIDTLHRYRNRFKIVNEDNVWNDLPDKEFLEMLGGYRTDRSKKTEGLTMAGLLMFGKSLPIRDVFDMINMDYREETDVSLDVRWNDRITYDGMWENNLYNFITRVMPKLTSDLPRPFRMEGVLREDDTLQHKACREAMINMIIHADFQGEGTLKVIKKADRFEFTNPGILKIPKEIIYKGGTSKPRNPRMQVMLRMIGYGDTAGSGFPTILAAWAEKRWPEPELQEDTILDQVTLVLKNDLKSDNVLGSEKGNIKETTKKTTKKTTKEKVVELIQSNPDISANEIADIIGISSDGVRYHINKMKQEGVLTREGPDKGGRWIINEK